MATLILSTVGNIIGGPIGQIVGAIAGAAVDRAIAGGGGGGRNTEGPRRADLYVQNATYGEPLPLLYGKYRAAGSVIWSTGLNERRSSTSSGGKNSSTSTAYSYFASFAVTLAARRIIRVERIWADGKLIRGSAQDGLSVGGTMRVYTGTETQVPDPLIEAAVGLDYAPAHRGLAYIVFEELPLAEFANRVPNLTFEIIADEVPPTQNSLIRDIASRVGLADLSLRGLSQSFEGFAISSDAPARTAIEALNGAARFALVSTLDGLEARTVNVPVAPLLDVSSICLNDSESDITEGAIFSRQPTRALASTLEVSFVDPARAYQTGIQRARSGLRDQLTGQNISLTLPAVLNADTAKQLAEANLAQMRRARDGLSVSVPIARSDLSPGTLFALATQPNQLWQVNSRRFRGGNFDLGCTRWSAADLARTAAADGGEAITPSIITHGPTVFHVLDLPPIENSIPTTPRVLIAASGPEAGWRQSAIWRSLAGESGYAQVANVSSNTVMGTARTVLGDASSALWDERSSVEVELLQANHEVLSQPEVAVLGGANLALLGDELIQFKSALSVGPKRFRLTGLLRGRRGTEKFCASHQLNERFVLLDPDLNVTDTPPLSSIGQMISYKATGPNESIGVALPQPIGFSARALRPLSPVHPKLEASTGNWQISWVRRSRAGFVWLDGADAPLGEEAENYTIQIFSVSTSGSTLVRNQQVSGPSFIYTAQDRALDRTAHTGPWRVEIAQLNAVVGAGESLSFGLPS
jgi:Putative phage tail protein